MNKIKKLIASVLALSLSASVMCFSVAAEESPTIVDGDYVAIAGGVLDFEGITTIPANITTYNTMQDPANLTAATHALASNVANITTGSLYLHAHYSAGATNTYKQGAIITAPTPVYPTDQVRVEINTNNRYLNRHMGLDVLLSNGETKSLLLTQYFNNTGNNTNYDLKYTVTFDPVAGTLVLDGAATNSAGAAFANRTKAESLTNVFGANGEKLSIVSVNVWYTFTNDTRMKLYIEDVTFKEARMTEIKVSDLAPGTKLDWYKRFDIDQTTVSADYGMVMERTSATAGRISTPATANRRTQGTTTAADMDISNSVGVVLKDIDTTFEPVIVTNKGASYNSGNATSTTDNQFKVNTTARTVAANDYLDIEITVPSNAENDVVWFLVDQTATSTNLNTLLSNSQIIDAGYAKLSASQGELNVTANMTGKTQGIYKLLVGSKNAVTGLANVNEVDYLPESVVNSLWTTFKASTESTLPANLATVTTRPAALTGIDMASEPYASNAAAINTIFLQLLPSCNNFNDARDAFNVACKLFMVDSKTTGADLVAYLTEAYTDFLCDFSGDYTVYEVDPDDYYTYFRESYDASTKTTLQEVRDAHKFALGMTTINIANKLGLYSAFEGLFDTYYDVYGCDNTTVKYAQYSSVLWRAFAGKDLSTKANIQSLYNAWNLEEEEDTILLGDLISGREEDYDKTVTGAQALIIALNNWNREQATVVSAKQFTDINGVAWAENAILNLYKKEIINGTGNGKFSPNATVTREQVVKMIVSAFNVQQNTVAPEFVDVDKDAWYAPYINAAYSADIIKGYDETQFGVGKNMTRADIAVVLYRYMKSKGIAVQGNAKQFNDAGLIPDYAQEAIAALSGAGVINGTDEGNFEPTKSATRAEFAVMLNSMLNLM